jgi:hypothetical protein
MHEGRKAKIQTRALWLEKHPATYLQKAANGKLGPLNVLAHAKDAIAELCPAEPALGKRVLHL